VISNIDTNDAVQVNSDGEGRLAAVCDRVRDELAREEIEHVEVDHPARRPYHVFDIVARFRATLYSGGKGTTFDHWHSPRC
jgi:hypothetical protein